jgi:hypothetical protein
MKTQVTLFKGELSEEHLRNYFLDLGYFVARGVKFKYEGNDVTDVDLFLYGRVSILSREKINVDAKNKKSPQVFERILWANGLKDLLQFDSCVVATTDKRETVRSFGLLHKTQVLDGTFLSKLKSTNISHRLSEEELLLITSKYRSPKNLGNKDWKSIYEKSKSGLLTEMDFSGFNETLNTLSYFLEVFLTDVQKKDVALRMIYILLSHLLLIIDFILKDIAFLEADSKGKKLLDGFTYGNLGRKGIDEMLQIGATIFGSAPPERITKSLENFKTTILSDYFGKNDTIKHVFFSAKEFERLGFNRQLVYPANLEPSLKGTLAVVLDFFDFDRKRIFTAERKEAVVDLFPINIKSNKEDGLFFSRHTNEK